MPTFPAKFSNLNDPRFCIMYLEMMPCTAKRHAEAKKLMKEWLVVSAPVKDANKFMIELTTRAHAALAKHSDCS